MPVYARKTSSGSPRFLGRAVSVISPVSRTDIPIPDSVVLCNGCNENIAETESKEGYLIYLGKRELKADQPYDIYCSNCTSRNFPKAIKV